jgi:hypothetical protein
VDRFLVEQYVGDGWGGASDLAERLATPTGAWTESVRHIRSLFVPADDSCFHVVAGASAEAVRTAMEHIEIPFERIVPVVEISPKRTGRAASERRLT